MMKLKFKKTDFKEAWRSIKDDLVVDKLNAVEWIGLGVILLLITISLFYSDNLGMFLTYFWINEGIFDGSIRFLGNNQLTYGIVQQYFCELWTLPVNIVYRFYKFEPANLVTVLWFKLSMPFVMTLCMSEMIKLGKTLNISKERIKWMIILFTSSVLVALPVFHIAQSDILYAYLVILGIHAFFKDDWKKFIIFFAMAVSCKAIAALVFVPLVLLREKRIFYVLRDSLLGVIIVPLERILYKIIAKVDNLLVGSPMDRTVEIKQVVEEETVYVEKSLDQVNVDFFSHFYHKSLFFEFPAIRKGYSASLLILLFVLLCIWCYAQKKERDEYWQHKVMFAASVGWMIFFANASPSPYWIVSMFPCWYLLMFMKPERLRINLLLQSAFTFSMFFVYLIDTSWVYGGSNNLDYLILRGILPEGHISITDQGPYVARYLKNLGAESMMNIVVAICLAAIIGLTVVNYHKANINEELTESEEKKLMHGFTIFQVGFLWVWYAVSVFVVSRW